MTSPIRAPGQDAAHQVVQEYHARTKHRFEAYARGPEALDWDDQPAPFRRYAGAAVVMLPLLEEAPPESALAHALARRFGTAAGHSLPLDLSSLAALLQLSLGLTAWKTYGPDRWAVRANPSSGNLHPLEAWVVARGLDFLPDGVWHYRPDEHALECRATFGPSVGGPPRLLLGLSSVMWREAWKYGERAFRYCQLDVGHGVGALGYAADVLGWRLAEQPQVGHGTLARLLGLDRSADFPPSRRGDTEGEEPELLLAIDTKVAQRLTTPPSTSGRGVGGEGQRPEGVIPAELLEWAESAAWHGQASVIDAHPFYRWPAIAEVAVETRRADGSAPVFSRLPAPLAPKADLRPAGEVILGRRSAQRFDPARSLSMAEFAGLLEALIPVAAAPWDVPAAAPCIDLLLYIHRVEGLLPGLYALLRSGDAAPLETEFKGHFRSERVAGMPPALRFLAPFDAVPLKRMARSLHCHQDLASNACFAVGMLARFDEVLAEDPAAYRDLYREAGLIGQVLYLEAEARGLNGCGIGCFFDDPVHESAGLPGERWQSLYHFTVGQAVPDPRIETSAPYPDRLPRREPT